MNPADLTGFGNYSDPATRDLIISAINSEITGITASIIEKFDDHVERVFRIAKYTYCPVDKGNLQDSAQKVLIGDISTERTWKISFGGPNAPYAPIVHEKLNVHHNNPPQACAKFLERAVVENQDSLVSDIMGARR